MREIKFRAWDKEKRKMYPVLELHFQYKEAIFEIKHYHSNTDEVTWQHFGKCNLMQFTGLKDKNGKEIYEGDIVETGIKSKSIVGFSEKSKRFGLFNDLKNFEEGYDWEGIDRFTEYPDYDSTQRLEVIGNIYENPELVK